MNLDVLTRKYRTPRVFDQCVRIADHDFRQLFIQDLGHLLFRQTYLLGRNAGSMIRADACVRRLGGQALFRLPCPGFMLDDRALQHVRVPSQPRTRAEQRCATSGPMSRQSRLYRDMIIGLTRDEAMRDQLDARMDTPFDDWQDDPTRADPA